MLLQVRDMNIDDFLSIEELMLIFDYTKVRSIRSALRAGPLKDLPTFMFKGRLYASPEVVNAFFNKFTLEGLAKLNEDS